MTDGTAGVTRTDAESLDTKSPPHEWERGWKLVAVSLVSYVLGSAGMLFAFGKFLKPLSSELHWSREEISGFTSISGVIFAVASPIVGRLADRFGVRHVILICVVLVAVIYGSQSLLTRHLWHYYALAFLWGPATAGTSALTFGKVISNWFDRSRGLALSILACGSGLGGVVIPPFAQSLIAHYGWREAYFLLRLSILTVGAIPVALILKRRSSDKSHRRHFFRRRVIWCCSSSKITSPQELDVHDADPGRCHCRYQLWRGSDTSDTHVHRPGHDCRCRSSRA